MLYQFPTKHALLRAMVEGWLDEFDAAVEGASAEEGEVRGGWLRAFIRVSAAHPGASRESAAPLLAAIAHDTGLLELVRERTARRTCAPRRGWPPRGPRCCGSPPTDFLVRAAGAGAADGRAARPSG